VCADARDANPQLGNPFDCFDRLSGTLTASNLLPFGSSVAVCCALAVAFPLGTLVVFFVSAWVIRGFRKPTS